MICQTGTPRSAISALERADNFARKSAWAVKYQVSTATGAFLAGSIRDESCRSGRTKSSRFPLHTSIRNVAESGSFSSSRVFENEDDNEICNFRFRKD